MWDSLDASAVAWTVLRATAHDSMGMRAVPIAAALAFYASCSVLAADRGGGGVRESALIRSAGPSAGPGDRARDARRGELRQPADPAHHPARAFGARCQPRLRGLAMVGQPGLQYLAGCSASDLGGARGRGPVLRLLFNRLRALGMVLLVVVFLLISLGVISAIEALERSSVPAPPAGVFSFWAVAAVDGLLPLRRSCF